MHQHHDGHGAYQQNRHVADSRGKIPDTFHSAGKSGPLSFITPILLHYPNPSCLGTRFRVFRRNFSKNQPISTDFPPSNTVV
jgi:hypothetical protein